MAGSETVWLVGMMGAGKSTVGEALARRLGRPFVDTDAEIEREVGLPVAEIFATHGEASFRERERAVIDGLRGSPAVVALGGGAIAEPGARERLADAGTLVYLRARPETLLARLGDCRGRPLLRGLPADARRERLEALLAARAPAYAAAAIAVDTDGRSPEEVAELVLLRLGAPAAAAGEGGA